MRIGAIILCGGKSRRMGVPKATLPFGPECMLARIVRLVNEVARPIAVVAAPGQELPRLPVPILTARDEREGQGPLEGLRAGLVELADRADVAFVVGCDVPLLVPGLISHMAGLLGQHDVVVGMEGEHHHPLCAVYRVNLLSHVEEILAGKRLRPVYLYDRLATRRVPLDQLRAVDPDLRSFMNLNCPDAYLSALEIAGFSPDPETLRRLGR